MNPNIEEGKYYFIRIKIYGRELEYKCKVKWIKGRSFRIATDDDTKLTFDLRQLVFAKEIDKKEVEKNEYKPLKIKGITKRE